MPERAKRHGVLAGGNFIVDHVKIIDSWPEQDTLASILSQSSSNGGGPYNVLKDLAILDPGLPLSAMCLVGDDPSGHWILDDCARSRIDTSRIRVAPEAATSYTDAMTVRDTGRRTFFHQRGANALLDVGHFDFADATARIFHLGYLLLLDRLDVVHPDGTTGASQVLAMARAAGLVTSVDCVSVPHPEFRRIALASLREADVFFVNEFEAGQILQAEIGHDQASLGNAAVALAELGGPARIILHSPHGAVSAIRGEAPVLQGSVRLPTSAIAGATGAGDAFAAGYLLALHQDLPEPERLRLAVSAGAVSLTDPTPSGGLRPAPDCLALLAAHGDRWS